MKRLAVFVSGTGSLLEAMIKDNLAIAGVLADRPCRGLNIARDAGIQARSLDRKTYGKGSDFDRQKYTIMVANWLKFYSIDYVAMAGFMTILDPIIFDMGYRNRILNIHPALLPAFKGEHAVRDALAYGVRVTGTTVHVATEELDAGRIIAQETVPVLPDDTEATLHERIKTVERGLYTRAIEKFMEAI